MELDIMKRQQKSGLMNNKLTEQDIIDAGLERVDVSAKESGDKAYHYYTYYFTSRFGLITPASDEIKNGWFVEVFETPEIKIKDREQLFNFINTINKMIKDYEGQINRKYNKLFYIANNSYRLQQKMEWTL